MARGGGRSGGATGGRSGGAAGGRRRAEPPGGSQDVYGDIAAILMCERSRAEQREALLTDFMARQPPSVMLPFLREGSMDSTALERAMARAPCGFPALVATALRGGRFSSSLAFNMLTTAAGRPTLIGRLAAVPELFPLLFKHMSEDNESALTVQALTRVAAALEATLASADWAYAALPLVVDCAGRELVAQRGPRACEKAGDALGLLGRIVQSSDRLKSAAAAAGAVELTVRALSHPLAASRDEGPGLMVYNAVTLADLLVCGSEQMGQWLAAAGGLPPLLAALRHPHEDTAVAAARATNVLLCNDKGRAVTRRLLEAGALGGLTALLRRAPAAVAEEPGLPSGMAARALHAVAYYAPDVRPILLGDGGTLPALVDLLARRHMPSAEQAARLLDLAARRRDAEVLEAAADVGAVPPLLALLALLESRRPVGGRPGGQDRLLGCCLKALSALVPLRPQHGEAFTAASRAALVALQAHASPDVSTRARELLAADFDWLAALKSDDGGP